LENPNIWVGSAKAGQGTDLSIVVPTFKERENVAELIKRISVSLVDVHWEVIFVDDDSPDGTTDEIRALAQRDSRVRCIQRIGRRGLTSACVEGILSSSSPYVAVMDADLQHDETILPQMLRTLQTEALDIVVGSRYVSGGAIGEWGKSRAQISQFATRLSHMVVPSDLRDPMSGFFMLRRDVFLQCTRHLSGMGFKILVDIFASSPKPLRFKEIPFVFKNRIAGESKLDNQVALDYVMLLLDKMVGHIIPVRFFSFALIGGLGLGVHFAVLAAMFKGAKLEFMAAQTVATAVAMVFNFALNNVITYQDRRLKGAAWVRGLLSFVLACSVGAFANVGIANYFYGRSGGWILAALSGILVGAVWNYAVTSVYTWGAKRG
jgi:dolichol-phosphate mannosyltransferase